MLISKFQKRVNKLVKEVLGMVTLRNEVNVRELFPEYEAWNHRYDIVVQQYNLIIECHGEQHKSLQSFGERNPGKVVSNFTQGKLRDRRKESIARENGWSYAVIWHNELSSDDEKAREFISGKLAEAFEEDEE